MGTEKVLILPKLNFEIWRGGIRKVPHKLRIKINRKYADEGNEMVSELEYIPVETFSGVTTAVE